MLDTSVKTNVVAGLEKIVGREYVTTNKADLYIYSQDLTPATPVWPDIVRISR